MKALHLKDVDSLQKEGEYQTMPSKIIRYGVIFVGGIALWLGLGLRHFHDTFKPVKVSTAQWRCKIAPWDNAIRFF